MKMRDFIKIGFLSTLLFLAACSPKTDYTNAIPKNASVVVAMELEQMAGKAGLKEADGKKAVDKLKTFLKGGLEGEAAVFVERIIEQPSETGLSFEEKVFLFATPHAEAFAVLASVQKESKLEELFELLERESISTPLREESGCRWAQVGTALCAFNNGTFLLLQSSKGDALGMKGTLLSLMRQKEGEGFAGLPEFEKVETAGNDIASIMNLSAIPYEWTTPLRMGLSADIRLEDIKYFLTADFQQGKVQVHSESLIQNPKVQGFFDVMDQAMQPIQGKLLDYYQGNTMLWAGGNIQGKELYRMLCQNPTIKQILDNPILPVDVEYIFSSIEGDFAIGYDNLMTGNFLLYAHVTNTSFLKTFEDLRPLLALTGGQITLDKVGDKEYLMRTYTDNYWFGIKDNRLYVTTDRIWAGEVGRTYGASLGVKPWAGEVQQNRFYLSVNGGEINRALTKYRFSPIWTNQPTGTVLQMLLKQSDYLNIGMSDWRHGKVEWVLKDKHTNLLQVFVDLLNQL